MTGVVNGMVLTTLKTNLKVMLIRSREERNILHEGALSLK